MKIFSNLFNLAEELGGIVHLPELEYAYERNFGRDYFMYGDLEVKVVGKDNNLRFVLVDIEDDKDCKDYIMTYELDDYTWKVYVDDIEGWQSCKVIDIHNVKLGIRRATVITAAGTQINRVAKFITDKDDEDLMQDGSVYYYEKYVDPIEAKFRYGNYE